MYVINKSLKFSISEREEGIHKGFASDAWGESERERERERKRKRERETDHIRLKNYVLYLPS